MSSARTRCGGRIAAVVVGTALLSVGPNAQQAAPFSAWSSPSNLGPIINSSATDQHPALSPDGLSLYWSSDRPGSLGGSDIWVARRASSDAPWAAPAPVVALNSESSEFAPAFDPSGRWLFFGSERPNGCGGRDLWASYRFDVTDDQKWGPPANLGCGSLSWSGFDDGPAYFQDGRYGVMLFISDRPGGAGGRDVWMATNRSGRPFGAPVNVVELNSPVDDARPAVRQDGLEFYVTSQRAGSVLAGGVPSTDIWVSTRATTVGAWSAPTNTVELNTASTEGAPALSFDGRTMVLHSNRTGGAGGLDLWLSTRTGGR